MKVRGRYRICKTITLKSLLIKNLSFLALLLLALSIYGCAGPSPYRMYPGEDRPKTEISTIEGSFVYLGIGLCIVSIIDVNQQAPGSDKVAVLPGFYTVTVGLGCVSYGAGGGSRSERIAFNAEAGHEYQIKAHWWKFVPDPFVVDKNSGEGVYVETGEVIQYF